jgi:hypothetical protein
MLIAYYFQMHARYIVQYELELLSFPLLLGIHDYEPIRQWDTYLFVSL